MISDILILSHFSLHLLLTSCYYNTEASFALPTYVREMLDEAE